MEHAEPRVDGGLRREGAADGPCSAQRMRWVREFQRAVASSIEGLCRLTEEETGKPAFQTLTGDIMPLLASCRWHRRRARRVLQPRRLGGAPLWLLGQQHRVIRVPIGRVAIIATWNYPIQLVGIQLVQAIVGGNAVMVKPSERTPRTQGFLFELAKRAADRAGIGGELIEVWSVDRQAGHELVRSGRFDHLVFTGSTTVGRRIAQELAGSLIPSTLELSGNDTAIVLADADLRLAARSIWYAATMNAGQTCMAPRRVLVARSVRDALLVELGRLASATGELRLIDAGVAARHRQLVAAAGPAGWLRGEGPDPGSAADGCAVRAAVLSDADEGGSGEGPESEEHFGPLLRVRSFETVEQAMRMCAGVDGVKRLATSVFTADTGAGWAMSQRLGSSWVTVNDAVVPVAHPGASLGGRGASGWGESRGEAGLLAMTRSVTVSTTSRWVRTPLDPPGDAAERQMAALVGWWYGGRRAGPD